LKNIAVIGGEGVLGADLVEYLSPFYSVTPITKQNYKFYIGQSFDIIVNANGNSKRFWANEHVIEDFMLSTATVYKSLFDFKFKKYIYISSSDVYENHGRRSLSKENHLPDIKNLSPYGLHKHLSEIIVKKHAKDYLILRCSMILGKNLKKGPIYDIMHNKSLFISKESRLQMITTKEISNVTNFLVKKKKSNEIFNVGGKGTVSFNNISSFFSNPVKFSKSAEKQTYEINVDKLNKMYNLCSSKSYLQEFLGGLQS